MTLIKRYGVAFLVGVIGVMFALTIWHAWSDHKNVHTLLQWAVQVENRLKAATPKAPQ